MAAPDDAMLWLEGEWSIKWMEEASGGNDEDGEEPQEAAASEGKESEVGVDGERKWSETKRHSLQDTRIRVRAYTEDERKKMKEETGLEHDVGMFIVEYLFRGRLGGRGAVAVIAADDGKTCEHENGKAKCERAQLKQLVRADTLLPPGYIQRTLSNPAALKELGLPSAPDELIKAFGADMAGQMIHHTLKRTFEEAALDSMTPLEREQYDSFMHAVRSLCRVELVGNNELLLYSPTVRLAGGIEQYRWSRSDAWFMVIVFVVTLVLWYVLKGQIVELFSGAAAEL